MAEIFGNTITTPIDPNRFGGGGGTDLSDVAPAIQNTISGGKESLTVNDVSPIPHKCSCKLVNNDVYKFDSSNILNLPTTPDEFANINCEIKADGTIVYNGSCQYGFNVIFRLQNLTVGTEYTFWPGLDSGNDFLNFITLYDKNNNEIEQLWDYTGASWFTFVHTENVAYYDVECIILGDNYAGGERWFDISGTITPKLESSEHITDFSTVKVNVNGAEYIPNADGTVTDIASVSPTMEITTNNEHVNICDFAYCVDTKKYIDNNSGGGSALGDIETALDNIIAIQENLIGGGNV